MKKDLTGLRYGRLTVLREAEPDRSPQGKSRRRWVCRCDCGNITTVHQSALVSKTGTRSCGCLQREAAKRNLKDLTGQRFGRLTVQEPAPLDKPLPNGVKTGWLCRCDCGNEIIVSAKDLRSGLRSCGCLLSDTAKGKIEANVLGDVDGTRLSAIKPDRPANSNSRSGVKGVYWSEKEHCWHAKIGLRKKTIDLGRFSTMEAAEKARRLAEEKYYEPILEAHNDESN